MENKPLVASQQNFDMKLKKSLGVFTLVTKGHGQGFLKFVIEEQDGWLTQTHFKLVSKNQNDHG